MPKLALNFICKDESHVILNMLESVKPIVDCIVACDTGSTDNTIELIKKFGEDNGIETHVVIHPFDNFENSRNAGMKALMEIKENSSDWWGFWTDCDETMVVDPNFNKEQFNKDLYMIDTYIGQMKYTRNTFFRLSKPFKWYGPVHEFIICEDKNITSGLVNGLKVDVKMTGASWQGNIPSKYLSHAHVLEKYINNDRSDPRWIFYTAQSYHDSSCLPDNKLENEERLRRSLKYYRERVSRSDGYPEEIFYAQYRVGTILRALEEPWSQTLSELLKAYTVDPVRGEPIKVIIDYYLQVGEWHNAYLFSKFAKVNFHGKNPYPQRLLFVDESLYIWKFLESHSASCFYTGRTDEAKQNFQEMLALSKKFPQYFGQDDLNKIQMNSQFFK